MLDTHNIEHGTIAAIILYCLAWKDQDQLYAQKSPFYANTIIFKQWPMYKLIQSECLKLGINFDDPFLIRDVKNKYKYGMQITKSFYASNKNRRALMSYCVQYLQRAGLQPNIDLSKFEDDEQPSKESLILGTKKGICYLNNPTSEPITPIVESKTRARDFIASDRGEVFIQANVDGVILELKNEASLDLFVKLVSRMKEVAA